MPPPERRIRQRFAPRTSRIRSGITGRINPMPIASSVTVIQDEQDGQAARGQWAGFPRGQAGVQSRLTSFFPVHSAICPCRPGETPRLGRGHFPASPGPRRGRQSHLPDASRPAGRGKLRPDASATPPAASPRPAPRAAASRAPRRNSTPRHGSAPAVRPAAPPSPPGPASPAPRPRAAPPPIFARRQNQLRQHQPFGEPGRAVPRLPRRRQRRALSACEACQRHQHRGLHRVLFLRHGGRRAAPPASRTSPTSLRVRISRSSPGFAPAAVTAAQTSASSAMRLRSPRASSAPGRSAPRALASPARIAAGSGPSIAAGPARARQATNGQALPQRPEPLTARSTGQPQLATSAPRLVGTATCP